MIPGGRAAVLVHLALAAATLAAFAVVRPPAPARLAGRSGAIAAAGRWAYWASRPLVAGADRAGLSADAVTLLGLLLSVAAGAAAGFGAWGWSAVLLVWGGLCDMLDGEIARRRGRVTRAGAFLDSNLDRLAEVALFFGLAAGFPDRRGVMAAMAALVASILVSYARARGEGLGVDCPPFGLERPHRLVLVLAALLVAPFVASPRALLLLEGICGAVAIGAGSTAAGRIVVIRRILLRREAERAG
ncbi:MAG TPA: CDP-alcohol phosphatidyltransferase family protein [Anaeromyxobacteraceae bacterium]|nr:CDP-alcohol phosphatidyltransferase family protein [Anaeromyxobacteraceae bacterium]